MKYKTLMSYDHKFHHRKSIRLPNYNYSQEGSYLITTCTQNRECLFGNVVDGEMRLNAAGQLIQLVWDEIPLFYPGVETDDFVIMPNHVHGIINIVGASPRACPIKSARDNEGRPQGAAPTLSLSDVVHRFKTMTTKRYIDAVKRDDWSCFDGRVWQRNYWERVIRNEIELNAFREYIGNNAMQWHLDTLHP